MLQSIMIVLAMRSEIHIFAIQFFKGLDEDIHRIRFSGKSNYYRNDECISKSKSYDIGHDKNDASHTSI